MKKIISLFIFLGILTPCPLWAKTNFSSRSDVVKEEPKAIVPQTIAPQTVSEVKVNIPAPIPAPVMAPMKVVKPVMPVQVVPPPVMAIEKKPEVKIEKQPEVKAEKQAAEPKKDAAAEDRAKKAESALKGVENQKAWVDTLEKQLGGEKDRLAKMQDEVVRDYKLDAEKLKKNGYSYNAASGKFVER